MYFKRTLSAFLCLASSAAAQSYDHFSVPSDQHYARIRDAFSCQTDVVEHGALTCETSFNLTGSTMPLRVRVKAGLQNRKSVTEYEFRFNRNPTRQELYPYYMTIVEFFDKDYAQAFDQHAEEKASFFKGRKAFTANGIAYTLTDTSSDITLTVTRLDPENPPKPFNFYASPYCNRKNNIRGWEAAWGANSATIEPVFSNIVADRHVEGKFYITDGGSVNPSFQARTNGIGSRRKGYITLFVDQQPVYQGKWVRKTEPTCCSESVEPLIPKALFASLPNGKEGILAISSDAEAKDLIAAGTFSLGNLREAADMATEGRAYQSAQKRASKCR